MIKKKILALSLAAAFVAPAMAANTKANSKASAVKAKSTTTSTANNKELAALREQITQMKQAYEVRMQALEQRLLASEKKSSNNEQTQASAVADIAPAIQQSAQEFAPAPFVASASAPASANGFNPAISLILGGTYAKLSQDPSAYRLQGFMPSGDEIGPGQRGFNLGESEMTLSANIDPQFSGQMTFSLASDNSASVEESFFQTKGLSNGMNLKVGRFLSSVGYINSQHAHTWDFVDVPLAYQAFFGGQNKPDGLQFKWLAPTDLFVELGAEAGSGRGFPGNDRNKNGLGTTSVFAHIGDDIGDSASWRAGLSYLHSNADNREFADTNALGLGTSNAFSGTSKLWIADAIFKWSPNGNATRTNLKLQGEYFHRNENGSLLYDTLSPMSSTSPTAPNAPIAAIGDYSSAQSGWYLQSIYQFMPLWRVGIRYDKLYSGSPNFGSLNANNFADLASYSPIRSSLMLDYSPSEFGRFRLQFAREQSRPNVTDNQIFLQYIMSLGTHGAHSF